MGIASADSSPCAGWDTEHVVLQILIAEFASTRHGLGTREARRTTNAHGTPAPRRPHAGRHAPCVTPLTVAWCRRSCMQPPWCWGVMRLVRSAGFSCVLVGRGRVVV